MSNVILRRSKLGKTSANAIASLSRVGITPILFKSNARNFRDSTNTKRVIQFPQDADLVFRWGCTADVPGNPTIINKARAIHVVSDKIGSRRLFAQEHFPTWTNANEVRFPCVVRPGVHHQGRNLHVATNRAELQAAINACERTGHGWYASPQINKVAEYRVFIVSGRAVCVAQKTPGNPNQVAWYVAQGGRFDNVNWDNWPLKAVRVSIEAFLKTGLDFGGVDVMVDAAGEVYVLEINSAPSLTSPYRQECFAKAFDYIAQHGPDVIPLPEARGNYRKFIHPAITENARV
jgi:hypothetical protein